MGWRPALVEGDAYYGAMRKEKSGAAEKIVTAFWGLPGAGLPPGDSRAAALVTEIGPWALRLCGRVEQADEFAVHHLVAGHHVAADPGRVGLLEVGDEAARLAHQDQARGDVPG